MCYEVSSASNSVAAISHLIGRFPLIVNNRSVKAFRFEHQFIGVLSLNEDHGVGFDWDCHPSSEIQRRVERTLSTYVSGACLANSLFVFLENSLLVGIFSYFFISVDFPIEYFLVISVSVSKRRMVISHSKWEHTWDVMLQETGTTKTELIIHSVNIDGWNRRTCTTLMQRMFHLSGMVGCCL